VRRRDRRRQGAVPDLRALLPVDRHGAQSLHRLRAGGQGGQDGGRRSKGPANRRTGDGAAHRGGGGSGSGRAGHDQRRDRRLSTIGQESARHLRGSSAHAGAATVTCIWMHPIERLRWIARDRDEAPTALAVEAAWAISELALDEPPAVVTACRRLVASHVTVGPLWWVAATVLVAPDPDQAARRAVGELCSDPTAELLAGALSQHVAGEAAVVVACPAETVLEALSHRPSSVVRVVGSSLGLRGEVRGFGALVQEASGWELDEAREAVDGAGVVLVEALAAGPRGGGVGAGPGP